MIAALPRSYAWLCFVWEQWGTDHEACARDNGRACGVR